ncbi:MAG TPA: hypothetical protein DD491_06840 [Halieaceae bacterium]|nr:hypothetical protein [Halieaceae bacterium]|tara:strand:- start:201 stop:464 length:264 start_codon:yes stop_codon:yes gene_type:complete
MPRNTTAGQGRQPITEVLDEMGEVREGLFRVAAQARSEGQEVLAAKVEEQAMQLEELSLALVLAAPIPPVRASARGESNVVHVDFRS